MVIATHGNTVCSAIINSVHIWRSKKPITVVHIYMGYLVAQSSHLLPSLEEEVDGVPAKLHSMTQEWYA